jgi:hypothetical protein
VEGTPTSHRRAGIHLLPRTRLGFWAVRLLVAFAAGLVVGMSLAACAGGNEEGGTASPVPARTGAAASPTVASSPAPTATPAASEADRAAAAAKTILGGVVDAACTPSPETPSCTIPNPSLGTPQHGTAAFGISSYPGGGAIEFLGQTPEGEWKFWFGTQNIAYQLTVLPGDMRVCAGGAGLNVRASPAVEGESLTLLNDDAIISVDRFVLTEPGSRSATTGVQAGFGWYHLTSPKEGWAFSKYLSVASLGDCSMHDAQVRE